MLKRNWNMIVVFILMFAMIAVGIFGHQPSLIQSTTSAAAATPALPSHTVGTSWQGLPIVSVTLSILALANTIWTPHTTRRDQKLNSLVAYRNLALIAQRIIANSISIHKRGLHLGASEGVIAVKALELVKYDDIKPAYLVEDFLQILHMSTRFHTELKRDFDDRELHKLEYLESIATPSLANIDRYLKTRKVTFTDKNFAVVSPNCLELLGDLFR